MVKKNLIYRQSTEGFKKMEKKRRVTNYLNNRDLLAQVVHCQQTGKMSNELVKMLTLLVERYSTKGNLAGYSYIEDMRSHAMVNLVTAWKKFNPEKSNNPFAFFTECVKNSFNQYLNYEDKESTAKNELLIAYGLDPSYNYDADDNSSTQLHSIYRDKDAEDGKGKKSYSKQKESTEDQVDFDIINGARSKPQSVEEE